MLYIIKFFLLTFLMWPLYIVVMGKSIQTHSLGHIDSTSKSNEYFFDSVVIECILYYR